jgi:alpha-beta hydrolase superfamily lysophospholipase
VFAPDRRGSGLSREARGDCRQSERLLLDVGAACRFARSECGAQHVHLVGHCFGALPALLYASGHGDEVISLTLSTPALYTRVGLAPFQHLRVALALCVNKGITFPIPYPEEWLTEDAEWLSKIRRDPLALRSVTAAFLYQIHRARGQLAAAAERLRTPTFMASAAGDRICDNERNRGLFARLHVPRRQHVDYPNARHIPEFSSDCPRFLRDLSEWTASTEPSPQP